MSSASHSTGVVGKWGQANFFSKTASTSSAANPFPSTPAGKTNKIFTSRQHKPCSSPPPAAAMAAPPSPSASPAAAAAAVAPFMTPGRSQSDSGRVEVSVRLRPGAERERDGPAESVVEVDESAGDVFVNFDKSFRFDRALGVSASQASLYDLCVRPLVEDCLEEGRHVAVLAYGQTGTGKTYTMGTDQKVRVSLSLLVHNS